MKKNKSFILVAVVGVLGIAVCLGLLIFGAGQFNATLSTIQTTLSVQEKERVSENTHVSVEPKAFRIDKTYEIDDTKLVNIGGQSITFKQYATETSELIAKIYMDDTRQVESKQVIPEPSDKDLLDTGVKIARYKLKSDGGLLKRFDKMTDEQRRFAQEHWQKLTAMVPETWRSEIKTYHVYKDSDFLAAVKQPQTTMTFQEYSVDANAFLNMANNGKSVYYEEFETIIHEAGHLISLTTEQLSDLNDTALLTDFMANHFKEGAYLKTFYNDFWSNVPKDWINYNATHEEKDQFYTLNEENFVTSYAATDVFEDFAESFLYFVILSTDDLLALDTAYQQKLLYFYHYPELLTLRYHMLKTMSEWKP